MIMIINNVIQMIISFSDASPPDHKEASAAYGSPEATPAPGPKRSTPAPENNGRELNRCPPRHYSKLQRRTVNNAAAYNRSRDKRTHRGRDRHPNHSTETAQAKVQQHPTHQVSKRDDDETCRI